MNKPPKTCLYCGGPLTQPLKGRKRKFCHRNCERMFNYFKNKEKPMFGIFKKKAAAAKVSMHKVENRDLMEAIVAGAILVAYADGDCSAEELKKLDGIITSNDNLKHFGSEIGNTIDKYATMYENGVRVAKHKLMSEIKDIQAEEEQKIEMFLITIDIAEADGNIDEAEFSILKEIGKTLGLNPENYI